MNKKIYLLPLLLLALIFVSCEETKEATKFDNWRARNEGYIDSLKTVFDEKTDPELKAFAPGINPKLRIYYKDKTPADRALGDQPFYTDSVEVFYRGYYIFGESFDGNFTGSQPNPDFDVPLKCYVDPFKSTTQTSAYISVISGWGETLQRMKVGQHWIIYLPYEMGYGTKDKDKIPGYSTLIFDIQLQRIVHE